MLQRLISLAVIDLLELFTSQTSQTRDGVTLAPGQWKILQRLTPVLGVPLFVTHFCADYIPNLSSQDTNHALLVLHINPLC